MVVAAAGGDRRRCSRGADGPAAAALARRSARTASTCGTGRSSWCCAPASTSTPTGWPVQVLRIALTLAAAELSYRFVEMPIRRGALGRAWAQLARHGTRRVGDSLAARAALVAVARRRPRSASASPRRKEPDPRGRPRRRHRGRRRPAHVADAAPARPSARAARPGPTPPPPPGAAGASAGRVDAFGLSSTRRRATRSCSRPARRCRQTFPGMTVDAAVSRQSRGVFDRIKARKDAGQARRRRGHLDRHQRHRARLRPHRAADGAHGPLARRARDAQGDRARGSTRTSR